MSYREVMEMPVKTFWAFNAAVGRLQAESELRLIQVIASAQTKLGQEHMEALRAEYGTPVVVVDERRDANATSKLRELLS